MTGIHWWGTVRLFGKGTFLFDISGTVGSEECNSLGGAEKGMGREGYY